MRRLLVVLVIAAMSIVPEVAGQSGSSRSGFLAGSDRRFAGWPASAPLLRKARRARDSWGLVGFYSSPFFVAPIHAIPIFPTPIYTSLIDARRFRLTAWEPVPPLQGQSKLADQVDVLTQEIGQLRQLLSSLQPRETPTDAAPSPEQPQAPTVLIFRDGRRSEVLNYVIVGQMLWILDQQPSTKVPLSSLDLETIRRENLQRGVRSILSR